MSRKIDLTAQERKELIGIIKGRVPDADTEMVTHQVELMADEILAYLQRVASK